MEQKHLSSIIADQDIWERFNGLLKTDDQFLAFCRTNALQIPLTFGIKSIESDEALSVTASVAGGHARTGLTEEVSFTLNGQASQWQAFFASPAIPPLHSYWGIRSVNASSGATAVTGNNESFAQFAHIWRRALELLQLAVHKPSEEPAREGPDLAEEDHLIGRYIYLQAPSWGRCRVYYEQSGFGPQPVVFIHTAGSDGRQFSMLMNDLAMRRRCTMYTFDIPAHGKSLPGSQSRPGCYRMTEEDFVELTVSFLNKMEIKRPIFSGASMAGNLCLAIAIHAEKIKPGGVIPLEACEHLGLPRWTWDRSPYVNQSLFNSEAIYPLIAPTAAQENKELLWNTYSGQVYGVLASDLDFYFRT
ncbi:MAG: hypothetical protein Q9162_003519 [Coniocarpon cinnabarinum]